MEQNRKYFGLTSQQLGILGGLVVAVCLFFGATGSLVVRRVFLSLAQSDSTLVPATATPFRLSTLVPTVTPTSIPYEKFIPEGWEQHKTMLVELWLPAGFKNADQNAGSFVLQNSAVRELSVAGVSPTTSKDTVYVSIFYEPFAGDSLDVFLKDRLTNLSEGARLVEQHKVLIHETEINRLVFERNKDNIFTNDLLFVFLDGGTIWYVQYSADIKDFFEMLPAFDDSIKTFRMAQ